MANFQGLCWTVCVCVRMVVCVLRHLCNSTLFAVKFECFVLAMKCRGMCEQICWLFMNPLRNPLLTSETMSFSLTPHLSSFISVCSPPPCLYLLPILTLPTPLASSSLPLPMPSLLLPHVLYSKTKKLHILLRGRPSPCLFPPAVVLSPPACLPAVFDY